jgi:hypothetical protein
LHLFHIFDEIIFMTRKSTFKPWIFPCILLLTVTTYAQQKPPKQPAVFGRNLQLDQTTSPQKIKCGTTDYDLYLRDANIKRNTNQEFETWLAPKVQRMLAIQNNENEAVLTIPVVVHVIHNNKAYGVQENILDEQILSQITVLNQDFRKQANTPGFNTNPVGADIKIEFCMAQRDPQGNASTGINRISLTGAGQSGWEFTDVEEIIKPQTQWNPNEYLNIWVVESITIFGFFEILGYAQFPVNSTLDGLAGGSSILANTDGVVIGHQHFGSEAIFASGAYVPGNDGRTATHEIGHYLGLRHIWGDTDACNDEGDFCNDTPPSTAANDTCSPNFSCDAFNMIENYMDYTPAGCQNIFTLDQKARMRTVMQFSPRRLNLLNSEACFAPQTNTFDLELKSVNLPSNCSTTFTPSVVLNNNGTNTAITSAIITYSFDGGANQTFNWTGNLLPSEEIVVDLPEVTFAFGNYTAVFEVTSINNGMDDYTFNNRKLTSFIVNEANPFNATTVLINIVNDEFGDETTWTLTSSNGISVASGGPYNESEIINETVTVVNNECYEFTVLDSFGDGICCEYGEGSYAVTTNNGIVIVSGGSFETDETTSFKIDQTLSNETFLRQNVSLYPNPTNNLLTIGIENGVSLPKNIEIFNTMGQQIGNKKIQENTDLTLDVNHLNSGVYFVKMSIDNQNIVLRFVKS